MRYYWILMISGICVSSMVSGTPKKVLFLGNSFTATNNLPDMLKQFALSLGDSLEYAVHAPGAHTFESHVITPASLQFIRQGGWDFVVLQEQSQRPAFSPAQVQQQVYPYARQLDSIVKAHNFCAKTVFFATWGYQNGDASNCASYPVICTYDGMQDRLLFSYSEMADVAGGWVAPVGEAWRTVRNQHPSISLYAPDGIHPSLSGSYLAAATFYTTLFHKSSVNTAYTSGIDSLTALQLRTAATNTVFNQLGQWLIDTTTLRASFTVTDLSPNQFETLDLSLQAQVSIGSIFTWTIAGQTIAQQNGQIQQSILWQNNPLISYTEAFNTSGGVIDYDIQIPICLKADAFCSSVEVCDTLSFQRSKLIPLGLPDAPHRNGITLKNSTHPSEWIVENKSTESGVFSVYTPEGRLIQAATLPGGSRLVVPVQMNSFGIGLWQGNQGTSQRFYLQSIINH